MTGDFSQLRFDKENRYSKVLHQQGRVFSDADLLEAAYIAAYFEETEHVDVIGKDGTPVHDAGFLVADSDGKPADGVEWGKLRLSLGRCYVHGKVAEVFEESKSDKLPLLRKSLASDSPGIDGVEPVHGSYFVALEVYERYVAPAEEPDQMLDDALRGVDTTGRSRVEWRIRLKKCDGECDCADQPDDWPEGRTFPKLIADAPAVGDATDPCESPNTGGYQGLENQLYRVEVYEEADPAAANPTAVVTWSRDNASLLTKIEDAVPTAPGASSGTFKLSTLGRDPKMGFQQAKVIEVLTEDDLRHGRRGILLDDFTPTGESEIVVNSGWNADLEEAADQGFVRRWDGYSKIKSKEKLYLEPDRKDIFVTVDDVTKLKRGDYWCIPTRALSGKVLWPTADDGTKIGRPPFGTYFSSAILGVLTRADTSGSKWTLTSDCRNLFYPLTEQTRLLYAGGDGQEAMPGEWLPRRLEVGVVNGVIPVEGAKVKWTITGGATMSVPDGTDVETDEFGISWVEVMLDGDYPPVGGEFTSQITARLLNEFETEVDVPVHFTVRKSVATNVAYEPPDRCTGLRSTETVHAAIDRLASIKRFTMEGGDGQVVRTGSTSIISQRVPEVLPEPLVVRVWNLCGPAVREDVTFTATGGEVWDGKDWVSVLSVVTDEFGNASCFWMPALEEVVKSAPRKDKAKSAPEVFAKYTATDPEKSGSWTLRFTCQYLDAQDISFDGEGMCETLRDSDTVREALDALCNRRFSAKEVTFDGSDSCEALHEPETVHDALDALCAQTRSDSYYEVVGAIAGNNEKVTIGGNVSLNSFIKGLTFMFSKNARLTPAAFNRGTVSVEAEMTSSPYDGKFGDGARVRIVLIEGRKAKFSKGRATWFPGLAGAEFREYIGLEGGLHKRKLLIRVTLRCDYMPAKLSDGSRAFLRNATSAIEPRKMKVSDELGGLGGNFEFWFWLVAKPGGGIPPVIIEHIEIEPVLVEPGGGVVGPGGGVVGPGGPGGPGVTPGGFEVGGLEGGGFGGGRINITSATRASPRIVLVKMELDLPTIADGQRNVRFDFVRKDTGKTISVSAEIEVVDSKATIVVRLQPRAPVITEGFEVSAKIGRVTIKGEF